MEYEYAEDEIKRVRSREQFFLGNSRTLFFTQNMYRFVHIVNWMPAVPDQYCYRERYQKEETQ
jgi:hypothetical protein